MLNLATVSPAVLLFVEISAWIILGVRLWFSVTPDARLRIFFAVPLMAIVLNIIILIQHGNWRTTAWAAVVLVLAFLVSTFGHKSLFGGKREQGNKQSGASTDQTIQAKRRKAGWLFALEFTSIVTVLMLISTAYISGIRFGL
jgi:hypothetical protein